MWDNKLLRILVPLHIIITTSCSTRVAQMNMLPRTLKGPYDGTHKIINDEKVQIPKIIKEVVIAEGNGKLGYQSIKIKSSNEAEVRIIEKDNKNLVRVYRGFLEETNFESEIEKLLLDINGLYKEYSTHVSGGSTAYILIKGVSNRAIRINMSNYFPKEIEELWTNMLREVKRLKNEDWEFIKNEHILGQYYLDSRRSR